MDSSCTQDYATWEDIGMELRKQTDSSYKNIWGKIDDLCQPELQKDSVTTVFISRVWQW